MAITPSNTPVVRGGAGPGTPRNPRSIREDDLRGECTRLNLVLNDIVRQIPLAAKAAVRQVISGPGGGAVVPTPPPPSVAVGLLMEILLTQDTTVPPPSVALPGQPLTVIVRQPVVPHTLTWGAITGSSFFFAPSIPLFASTTSVIAFVGGNDGAWYGTSQSVLGAGPTSGTTRTSTPSPAVTGTLVDITLNSDTTTLPPSVATAGAVLTYIVRQPATPANLIWGSIAGSQFFYEPTIPPFANTVSTVAFVGGADGNWYATSMPILGATTAGAVVRTSTPAAPVIGLLQEVTLTEDTIMSPPSIARPGEALTVIVKQPPMPHALTWNGIAGSQFFFGPAIPVVSNTTSVIAFVGGSDGNWYCAFTPTLGASLTRAAIPAAAATGLFQDVTLTTNMTISPPSISKAGEALTYIIRQPATPNILTWGTIIGSRFLFAPDIPLFANMASVVPFVGGTDGNWYVTAISILGA